MEINIFWSKISSSDIFIAPAYQFTPITFYLNILILQNSYLWTKIAKKLCNICNVPWISKIFDFKIGLNSKLDLSGSNVYVYGFLLKIGIPSIMGTAYLAKCGDFALVSEPLWWKGVSWGPFATGQTASHLNCAFFLRLKLQARLRLRGCRSKLQSPRF